MEISSAMFLALAMFILAVYLGFRKNNQLENKNDIT